MLLGCPGRPCSLCLRLALQAVGRQANDGHPWLMAAWLRLWFQTVTPVCWPPVLQRQDLETQSNHTVYGPWITIPHLCRSALSAITGSFLVQALTQNAVEVEWKTVSIFEHQMLRDENTESCMHRGQTQSMASYKTLLGQENKIQVDSDKWLIKILDCFLYIRECWREFSPILQRCPDEVDLLVHSVSRHFRCQ